MAKATITSEQVAKIASRVIDTRNNVYRVAEDVLGHEAGDEIFDLLKKQERIFKCENCGNWLPVACEATTDWCIECIDNEKGD